VALDQFDLLRRKILPAIGFRNVLMQKGLEADDLIAKTVWQKEGINFIIVASDEDLFQLLQFNNVRMYNPNKRKMMTKSRFEEEYGIRADQWTKVKQIAGCPDDNVPGIPGVGNKTVIKFLRAELKHSTKAWQNIAAKHQSDLYERNIKLTTLPHKVTQDVVLVPDEFDIKGFKKICKKYGMVSFLKPNKLLDWKGLFRGYWDDNEPVKEVKGKRTRTRRN
jgi:5'-3' exonuclease